MTFIVQGDRSCRTVAIEDSSKVIGRKKRSFASWFRDEDELIIRDLRLFLGRYWILWIELRFFNALEIPGARNRWLVLGKLRNLLWDGRFASSITVAGACVDDSGDLKLFLISLHHRQAQVPALKDDVSLALRKENGPSALLEKRRRGRSSNWFASHSIRADEIIGVLSAKELQDVWLKGSKLAQSFSASFALTFASELCGNHCGHGGDVETHDRVLCR
jgi:hypothetical protein